MPSPVWFFKTYSIKLSSLCPRLCPFIYNIYKRVLRLNCLPGNISKKALSNHFFCIHFYVYRSAIFSKLFFFLVGEMISAIVLPFIYSLSFRLVLLQHNGKFIWNDALDKSWPWYINNDNRYFCFCEKKLKISACTCIC